MTTDKTNHPPLFHRNENPCTGILVEPRQSFIQEFFCPRVAEFIEQSGERFAVIEHRISYDQLFIPSHGSRLTVYSTFMIL